jgi:hypothetical protein
MLSSVLRSSRAVEVNIAIMRTFVQLRRLMDTNRDLARKIESLPAVAGESFRSNQCRRPPSPLQRFNDLTFQRITFAFRRGRPRTSQATEQPQDQNDNQNRSEHAMRSVTESITACWESAQQE